MCPRAPPRRRGGPSYRVHDRAVTAQRDVMQRPITQWMQRAIDGSIHQLDAQPWHLRRQQVSALPLQDAGKASPFAGFITARVFLDHEVGNRAVEVHRRCSQYATEEV